MASYNNLSNSEFNAMQQEAIRRVREMQKRSNEVLGKQDNAQQINEPTVSTFSQSSPQKPPSQPPPKPQSQGISLKSLFGDIKIDEEKALIGLVMYVLYKNSADMKLILALGYLLL